MLVILPMGGNHEYYWQLWNIYDRGQDAMSMPNPQYEQVLRIVSEVAGIDQLASVWLSDVGNNTKYFVNDEPVECLGLYKNDRVAIFGQWQGSEDQKPVVSAMDIQTCSRAFLVRSRTAEEAYQHAYRKMIVCLGLSGSYGSSPAERIFFYTTRYLGFYNPVV